MKYLWTANAVVIITQLVLSFIGLYFTNFENPLATAVIISGGVAFLYCIVGSRIFNATYGINPLIPFVSIISVLASCSIFFTLSIVDLGLFQYILSAIFGLAALWFVRFVAIVHNYRDSSTWFQASIIALPFGVGVILGLVFMLFLKEEEEE